MRRRDPVPGVMDRRVIWSLLEEAARMIHYPSHRRSYIIKQAAFSLECLEMASSISLLAREPLC